MSLGIEFFGRYALRASIGRGAGGRPETFRMRELLVAMVLCVTSNESLLVCRRRRWYWIVRGLASRPSSSRCLRICTISSSSSTAFCVGRP